MTSQIQIGRPRWSSIPYAVFFAAFITIVQNIAYYRQTLHLLDMTDWVNILFFFSMPVVIFAVLNIVFTALFVPYLRQSVIVLFLLSGATAQYFMLNYGIIIDRTMIQNIIETTPIETASLITPQLIVWLFLLGIVPSLLALWIKIIPAKPTITNIGMHFLSIIASLFAILFIAVIFYKDYASLMRNNKELVKSITPSNIVAANLSYYKHNALANLPLVKIGQDAHKKTPQSVTAKKNLVILVVGETTRAQNFSLGGYPKETNPRLAKDNVIYFDNTTSCGTSTGVSVPCMFSNMPRTGFNGELASHQEGLLDILQRANVNVLWQENDGGCKGVCARVPTTDITKMALPEMCSGGDCHDEALLHGLEDYINKLNNDGIIVLHTMGSHGPSYYQRYPATFKKFTPTCDTNQIQQCSQEELTNTYDNTIVYIDYMLDKTINLLKSHQDKFNTALVYLSDHGESLGENGIYLHSMPYSVAPEQQTHIPMLMWLSESYKQQFAIQDSCLRKNAKQQAYSQDNLFHTILGMFTIETAEYQRQLDILQPCRGYVS
ncbi:phosphoethanolamine transferase EptA [Brenneria rubrifaciens]|uniref:Phosphoethanolamine transferase EptA n=1 Tax=Brenneria rubrifaciens TaxID=55213 RepID=A0A4P8QST2_9GAMM|nr:phosphoethanolamine transferase EptA [Brenneria rubrifaciens]QCR07185.1 phosphoethanolamine transferase EptA [Brenneria rubrifaciens]